MNELVTISGVRGYVDENGTEIVIGIEFVDNKPINVVIGNNKLNRFDMLCLAKNAINEKRAWEIINLASILFHWQDDFVFNSLYGSVATSIAWKYDTNEYSIHSSFKKNIKNLQGENNE